jgi:hypothetical protein
VSTHYSDDDLTLYYYGETRRQADIEQHLQDCSACATLYREIAGTLSMVVAEEAPERGDRYGLEVWQRIRHRLPERESRFAGFTTLGGFAGFTRFAGFAAAAAVLMLAAFVAGRSSMNRANLTNPSNVARSANPANPENPANPANAGQRQRILVSSVADHLDRSERVLTDIMNASNPGDISIEQGWAEDLVTTSRLYRQDALEAGEQSIATVLDDLERNLLEIVHSPAKISAADLEQIRRRIDAAALLFKVRVMSDQLRDREAAPADRIAPRATTSKVS